MGGRQRGNPPPYLTDEDEVDLYLLWRHTGGRVEPETAWRQWPAWQFELLVTGLRKELEMEDVPKSGKTEAGPARESDWSEFDGLLEDLEA